MSDRLDLHVPDDLTCPACGNTLTCPTCTRRIAPPAPTEALQYTYESRSPDGDGQTRIKALIQDTSLKPHPVGEGPAAEPERESAGVVIAPQGDERLHGSSERKSAAGSEPADSHHPTEAPAPDLEALRDKAAARSAAEFANRLGRRTRHAEAVADCAGCNLTFLATWVLDLLGPEPEKSCAPGPSDPPKRRDNASIHDHAPVREAALRLGGPEGVK